MHFRFPSLNFVKNAHFPDLKFLKMSRELLSTFWKGTQPNSELILIDFMELGLCDVIWIRWWITSRRICGCCQRRDAMNVFKFVSFTDNFCNQIFAISKPWNKILNFAWFNGDYRTNIASNSEMSWSYDCKLSVMHRPVRKYIVSCIIATRMHSVTSAMMRSTRGGRCRPGKKMCSHCDYSTCAFEANLKSTWFTPAAKFLEFF
jgi:hypothetical protein